MDSVLQQVLERMNTPEELENTIRYLTEKIGRFLKRRERVLICLPDTVGSFGWVMGQAVERCEGVPFFLGQDRRWKTLMRTAFSSRCSTIVAEPLVLLGVSKLAKAMGVPLFIRNAIFVGYPCMPWMREGIQRGLDCATYGCVEPGGVVAGFVTKGDTRLWLRSELFDAWTRDQQGNRLPDNEEGEIVLRLLGDEEIFYPIGNYGRICHVPGEGVYMHGLSMGRRVEPDIAKLSGHLHRWTSILDCRVTRGSYGLELEIVTFPGEKLPKLPSCAKQVVRPWEPETEVPLFLVYP